MGPRWRAPNLVIYGMYHRVAVVSCCAWSELVAAEEETHEQTKFVPAGWRLEVVPAYVVFVCFCHFQGSCRLVSRQAPAVVMAAESAIVRVHSSFGSGQESVFPTEKVQRWFFV